MKTIKRLVVSPHPIDHHTIRTQDELIDLTYIKDVVIVQNEYRHVPGILNKLELESDDDIAEKSIRDAVMEPGYVNIHLVLTDKEWNDLGLRSTLYGQFRLVDGQIITYARVRDEDEGVARRYREKIEGSDGFRMRINEYSEEAIVAWHELHHGLNHLGHAKVDTHWVFYGYASKYKDWSTKEIRAEKPRRWVRSPKPREDWETNIDFASIDDRSDEGQQWSMIKLLQEIVRLMTWRNSLQPTKTNREKLYDAAVAELGRDASPDDLAPDNLGCADSVTNIIRKVRPTFPIVVGTWTLLYEHLLKETDFIAVDNPEPGDVIINATGTGNGEIVGHVGIVAKNDRIMSNTSAKGIWEENFSMTNWDNYYRKKGGMPTYYFRLRD